MSILILWQEKKYRPHESGVFFPKNIFKIKHEKSILKKNPEAKRNVLAKKNVHKPSFDDAKYVNASDYKVIGGFSDKKSSSDFYLKCPDGKLVKVKGSQVIENSNDHVVVVLDGKKLKIKK